MNPLNTTSSMSKYGEKGFIQFNATTAKERASGLPPSAWTYNSNSALNPNTPAGSNASPLIGALGSLASYGGAAGTGIGSYLQGQGALRSGAKAFLTSQGLGGLAEGADQLQQFVNKNLGTKEHSAWNDFLQYGPLGSIYHYTLE